ncbi:MAG: hypothetical protein ACR2KZ_13150 [Segetibacter sp.]
MKTFSLLVLMLLSAFNVFAQQPDSTQTDIQPGEYWWGGLSAFGNKMPYDANTQVTYDLWGDNKGNQAQPLLLSSKGPGSVNRCSIFRIGIVESHFQTATKQITKEFACKTR